MATLPLVAEGGSCVSTASAALTAPYALTPAGWQVVSQEICHIKYISQSISAFDQGKRSGSSGSILEA